jgi:hypothetical protein
MSFICSWNSAVKIPQESTMEIVEHTINIISIMILPLKEAETLQWFDHLYSFIFFLNKFLKWNLSPI